DGARKLAIVIHLDAHGLGKTFHHLRGEAYTHAFVENGLLSLLVGRRRIPFLLKGLAHFVVPFLHDLEFLERFLAQIFNLLAAHAAGRAVVIFLIGYASAGVIFAFFVHQTVDEFVNLERVFTNAVGVIKDFAHGRRAGGNGHDHVLEAVFDALGDFNFTLTGKQFDGTHFTHVHADWVCGATEIGIHRGERRFSFVFNVVIAGCHRSGVAHQQGVGVRSLVVDRNAHITERADNAV